MTINNKGNLFVFEVGPSVKFVSAIKDAIFKKKMGVIFLFGKMPNWGGGSEGSLAKDQTFSGFFFLAPFPNDQCKLPLYDVFRITLRRAGSW